MTSRRPRRSIRRHPTAPNPAVVAAGHRDTLSVGIVGRVARRIGYDAEECIQKALEDDEIEIYGTSPDGRRECDVYRLTAKGRRALDRHLQEVFWRTG